MQPNVRRPEERETYPRFDVRVANPPTTVATKRTQALRKDLRESSEQKAARWRAKSEAKAAKKEREAEQSLWTGGKKK